MEADCKYKFRVSVDHLDEDLIRQWGWEIQESKIFQDSTDMPIWARWNLTRINKLRHLCPTLISHPKVYERCNLVFWLIYCLGPLLSMLYPHWQSRDKGFPSGEITVPSSEPGILAHLYPTVLPVLKARSFQWAFSRSLYSSCTLPSVFEFHLQPFGNSYSTKDNLGLDCRHRGPLQVFLSWQLSTACWMSMHQNHLEDFIKHGVQDLVLQSSQQTWDGNGNLLFSKKLPGDGDAADPWTTLWERLGQINLM